MKRINWKRIIIKAAAMTLICMQFDLDKHELKKIEKELDLELDNHFKKIIMNIRLGLKFTSVKFPGIAEIIDVQENKNIVSIEIDNNGAKHQEDDVNLKELTLEFENKTCESIDTTKHLLNKHGQLENEGAYSD